MPPPSRPRGFTGSSSGGSAGRPAPNTPMSERQQMALLMQMTSSTASPSTASAAEMSPGSSGSSSNQNHGPARSRDRNERGETALHVAAIKGDQDAIKKLLESGMSPNVADFAGWTPLHEACNHAHYNVALTLVKAGANVNAKGLDDDTPLHDAAIIGHLKLVKMLVEKGADPNFKNRKGKTPADVAVPSVAGYLNSVRDNPSPSSSRISQQSTSVRKPSDQKKTSDDGDDASSSTTGGGAGSISSLKEEDDIYEFKSTPKDSAGSGSEDKPEPSRKGSEKSDEKSGDEQREGPSTSGISNTGCIASSGSGSSSQTKRTHSDTEGNDDGTESDEMKRKKRKDSENLKDSGKPVACSGRLPQRQEKTCKTTGNSTKSSGILSKNSSSLDRKSPVASPKPSSTKTTDSDAETEDSKNSVENFSGGAGSGGSVGGPKVPPLKIVIPQQSSAGDMDNNSRNGKSSSARSHAALPYVVPSSSNSNDSLQADKESASSRCASPAESTGKGSNSGAPTGGNIATGSSGTASGSGSGSGVGNSTKTEDNNSKAANDERSQPRVLRSSHRSGGQGGADRGSNNSSPQLQSSSPSPAPATETPNESSGGSTGGGSNTSGNGGNAKSSSTNNPSPATQAPIENETSGNVPSPSASSTSSKEAPQNAVELHPRKRKIRANKQDESSSKTSTNNSNTTQTNNDTNANASDIHPHDHPFTNCYQMFLNIRKQIEKKHKTLFSIQPRPPQGFKDYLMNRKTYVLASKTSSEPMINYPASLPALMKDLFTTQEKERHKLKMQHIVEKEKLGLTVEQEIIRVHGKAARSLACQSVPFSACTILKDEEVYNMITPEQEEKDRNARSRYNGRLFLSWLQDVDDKWEKIKEAMVLRHHNEAESLHAVQKMDWEWALKESSLCDYKSQPIIDDQHVPMVHVSDDFDLLPA